MKRVYPAVIAAINQCSRGGSIAQSTHPAQRIGGKRTRTTIDVMLIRRPVLCALRHQREEPTPERSFDVGDLLRGVGHRFHTNFQRIAKSGTTSAFCSNFAS